ncbi:MAG: cell envelope integrity protein TolA [Dokdonella sp.]
MESFGDKLRAFGFALALHVLAILLMVVGLWWTHETRPVTMPGPVIEATLVGPTAAPKAHSGASKPTPPKPAPAPLKPEPPKPEPAQPQPPAPKVVKETPAEVQHQDAIERERVTALATEKAEQEKKEQEEKHHQEQVLLDEQKERKLKQEQQKQLADIKKQREAADKKVKLEQERLAQLEDRNQQKAEQRATPAAEQEAPVATTGANGKDTDLAARYSAAIQAAVTQSWNRPEGVSPGIRCDIHIVQIPGGDVIGVTVGSPCNADPITRNTIEQAVRKAAPLPYQGYEKVFERNINFHFKYDGDGG